jgi:hypothetical protein
MDLERNNESETRPQNLKVGQPQRDWRILIGTLDPTAWLAGPCTIERSLSNSTVRALLPNVLGPRLA